MNLFDLFINLYDALQATAFFCFVINKSQFKPYFYLYAFCFTVFHFVFITYINVYIPSEGILFFVHVLSAFVFMRLATTISQQEILLYISIPYLVVGIVNTCCMMALRGFIFTGSTYEAYMAVYGYTIIFAVHLLQLAAFICVIRFIRSMRIRLSINEGLMICLAMNICNYMTVCFENVLLETQYADYYLASGVLITAVLGVFIALMAKNINKKNVQIQKEKYENELLQKEKESAQKVLKMRNELYEIRHDLKHFVRALSQGETGNKSEEIVKMIRSYENEMDALDLPVETSSQAVNLILNSKIKEARDTGLHVKCLVAVSNTPDMAEEDIYLVLSNLMDNAIRYCDDRKQISVTLKDIDRYFVATITNSCHKQILDETGEFAALTPSMEHGYGIMTVRNIINSYPDAMLHFKQQFEYFAVSVFIPGKEEVLTEQ